MQPHFAPAQYGQAYGNGAIEKNPNDGMRYAVHFSVRFKAQEG